MDYEIARRNMVESQVRTNKVTDLRLLDRMKTVPRELFVPKTRQALAYVDECLDIGEGRYLMEPCCLGRLLQGAALQPGDVALVIGCGTGYAAAIIAGMAATVFALDRGVLPPTANYLDPDPECDLDVIPNEAREKQVDAAISNSFAFGGLNAAVVFRRWA